MVSLAIAIYYTDIISLVSMMFGLHLAVMLNLKVNNCLQPQFGISLSCTGW